MAADARRLMALSMVGPLAEEVAAQIDANLPVTPGSIENADIAADADIAFSKLDATTTAEGIEAAVAAKTEIAALTAIATADATDLATVITLANATKTKVNAIIAALKA